MERRRVVITGLGAVTPLGLTARESWRGVREGVCGIGPIRRYDPAGMKVQLAAEVKGFEPDALFGKPEAKRMGRFTQFALAAAREALADGVFQVEEAEAKRCGVMVSSGIGGIDITEEEHDRGLARGLRRRSQRRGGRLPLYPGRLRRGDAVRRRGGGIDPSGCGRVHFHEGAVSEPGSQPGLHSL